MTTAKKIFVLIACLALFLMSAGVCFADSFDFLEIPLYSSSSAQDVISNGVSVGCVNSSLTTQLYYTYSFPSNSPQQSITLFSFAFLSGGYVRYGIAYDSSDLLGTVKPTLYSAYSNGTNFTSSNNIGTLDSSSDLYFWNAFGTGTSNENVSFLNVFSSKDDALSALRSYIDHASAVADSTALSIPAGYALKISSPSPFDIGEIHLSYSNTWNFPSSSGSSTRSNGARLGLIDDSNISNGLSADTGTLINWSPTNANLFGRASNYSYSSLSTHSTSDGFSYVITNPLYGGQYIQSDGSDLHQNVALYAFFNYSHTDPVSFTLVPLKAVLSYDQGIFSYSNIFDIADGVYPGTVTPGQGTDPGSVDFGDTPYGGGNSDEPPLSENTTIFGLLNTLTNYFTGFFNSAINAIQSLFSTGSNFMQSVLTMFSWLPVELTTIIFSAFVILLVVGVLKLLWR